MGELCQRLLGWELLGLDPKDTIVAPEDLERGARLKEIKDIATILGQMLGRLG